MMLGYYKNPEATAQIIDANGWLHTGDLGTLDEEGYVTVRGRSKNLLLTSSAVSYTHLKQQPQSPMKGEPAPSSLLPYSLPVSYTHLDVYKRQTLSSVIREETPEVILLDMNFTSGINTGNEGLFWLHEIKKVRPELPCLLYTSRCV